MKRSLGNKLWGLDAKVNLLIAIVAACLECGIAPEVQ